MRIDFGKGFNSLFIGIGSAISETSDSICMALSFQFPFHRDRLCNLLDLLLRRLHRFEFQFPFHRDRLCNPLLRYGAWPKTWYCFNSLFIGIGSAIYGLFCGPRCRICFNSLFIGIGSAIGRGIDPGHVLECLFQFPFHRDRLCNLR